MSDRTRLGGSPEVVCIGEALVQLAPPAGERLDSAACLQVHAAGAEMNVAVSLARLGHQCAFVSRVGVDPFGTLLLSRLREVGVDTSCVVRDPDRPTGVYFKDHVGQQTVMHYYRSGSAASNMGAGDLGAWALGRSWIVVSGVFAGLGEGCRQLVHAVIDAVDASGGKVVFDVNYRPGLWSVEQAAQPLLSIALRSDLVLLGQDEGAALWGANDATAIRKLLAQVPDLVVKDGPVGATYMGVDGTVFVPSLPVQVTEPVGAGDAFAAGYLAGTLRGKDIRTAMRWGHMCASAAMTSVADQVAPPPPEQLALAEALSERDWLRADCLPSRSSETLS